MGALLDAETYILPPVMVTTITSSTFSIGTWKRWVPLNFYKWNSGAIAEVSALLSVHPPNAAMDMLGRETEQYDFFPSPQEKEWLEAG